MKSKDLNVNLAKKIKLMLVITSAALLLLTGCCLKHEWKEATCTEAETCTKCGETNGEPLGHKWIEATCAEPKTCDYCGATEGDTLEHTWEEATCTEPKTCKVCGETEGEALDHQWSVATVDAPKTCEVCGETEGKAVEFKIIDLNKFNDHDYWAYMSANRVFVRDWKGGDGHTMQLSIMDMDGNSVKDFEIELGHADGSWSGSTVSAFEDYVICAYNDSYPGENVIFELYDSDGELWTKISVPMNTVPYDFNKRFPRFSKNQAGDIIEVYNDDMTEIVGTIDLNSLEWASADDYVSDKPSVSYDEAKWSYYGICEDGINRHLVHDIESEEWGYVDDDGNVIAMYIDATDYAYNGFALVTNDGVNYDLIDKDGNMIGEAIISGDGASCTSSAGLFNIRNGEERTYALVIPGDE